jgi:hypothetical protein
LKFRGTLGVVGKLETKLRFNRVYFTIFRAKVWKILIFEWILLLEIQKKFAKIGFAREN